MDIDSLKESYNQVIEKYCKFFCEKYELEEYDASMWVSDDIGGVLCASDYFINFSDIKYCVDNNVSWKDFVRWYDYCIDLGMIDTSLPMPNLNSWIHGCPRMSLDDINRLKSAKEAVEEAKRRFEEEVSKTVFK